MIDFEGLEILKYPDHEPIGEASNEAMYRYQALARHLAFIGKFKESIEILTTLGFERKNIRKFITWARHQSMLAENKNIIRLFEGTIEKECLQ